MKIDSPQKPLANFVFAHGAGTGMQSDFMQSVAAALQMLNIRVLRFDFAYMQTTVETGKKRPPDRLDKLQSHYLAQLTKAELTDDLPLFIGGKSMGGRVATTILQQSRAIAGIVFGYPFHPPGKPEKLRVEHLTDLSKPLLILQGERDTFGKQSEVSQYRLNAQTQVRFFADGDHSLKPRKASGFTQDDYIQQAAQECADFIQGLI